MDMTDEDIFEISDKYGWLDDFGRWNFNDDGLIKFALAIKTAEWVGLTDEEKQEAYYKIDSWRECVAFIEAKLKEKNNG
jgi:hypothetical protein